MYDDETAEAFADEDIRTHHETVRRTLYKDVFMNCAPFTKISEVHHASKLASNAVINFDEFFKANSNDN